MAYTQEQLDKLEEAIAQGAKSVQYADKKIEYRSFDEMLKLASIMRKELGLTTEPTRRFAQTSKGLT